MTKVDKFENPTLVKMPQEQKEMVLLIELTATCRRRRQYDPLDVFAKEGEEEEKSKPSSMATGKLEPEPRFASIMRQKGNTIGYTTRFVVWDWGKGLTVHEDSERKSQVSFTVPVGDITEVRISRWGTHAVYIAAGEGQSWEFDCDSGPVVEKFIMTIKEDIKVFF